jgi:hypothetical protein
MRLLLDNNLSPRLVGVLVVVGWDVVHVRKLRLQAAHDENVPQAARDDDRILSVLIPISGLCRRPRVLPDRQWCSSGGSSVDELRILPHN